MPDSRDSSPVDVVRHTQQHDGLPVAGYLPQSNAAVDRVNRNKAIEEQCLRVLDALALQPDVDLRWLAIGRTDIEKGFMSINRAVFKPARVKLPGDAA
jgi:hypothetical protein